MISASYAANTPGLAEKPRLVHCHGSPPDGTNRGQTGPEGKKAFALETRQEENLFPA